MVGPLEFERHSDYLRFNDRDMKELCEKSPFSTADLQSHIMPA